jgi:putative transposase
VSWIEQCRELVPLKQEFPEYKEVGSHVLQNTVKRLDRSFQNFFRRVKKGQKPGFPRFQGKDRYDSFMFPDNAGWKIEGRNLIISKVGRLKMFLSRPIEGDIKTVTVKRSGSGKWFVTFSCDNVPEKVSPINDDSVGIDVGLKVFLADSEGGFIDNPRFYRETQKELRRKQRSLSRKKRSSSNRKKAKVHVAKCHEKVANQRNDFITKTARHYVQSYGNIYIEDLKIANMLKNRHLSKNIADASWGIFLNKLEAAAEEARRRVVRVNPKNTSQMCLCGEMVKKTLAVRVHNCTKCGLVMDRDTLAAKNILRVGQTLQALTKPLGLVA